MNDKDFDQFYPASRGRPLTPEEKEAIKAQAAEVERQEEALKEIYPKISPPRPADGRPKTLRDVYPKSVADGHLEDAPFSDGAA